MCWLALQYFQIPIHSYLNSIVGPIVDVAILDFSLFSALLVVLFCFVFMLLRMNTALVFIVTTN